MLEAKLIVVGGEVKTTEVRLKLPTTIGRGKEATLTLPHALISRLHCEITERDGTLIVRDLGSLNGTYVNNQRIAGEHSLLPDELLTLGTITFRASYRAATATTPLATEPRTPSAHVNLAPPAGSNHPVNGTSVESNELHVPNAQIAAPTATTVSQSTASQPTAANSDIFAEILKDPSVDQSVSLSAIGQLPTVQPAASFVGGFIPADSEPARTLDVDLDAILLDHGSRTDKPAEVDEQGLGNFLRNIPK